MRPPPHRNLDSEKSDTAPTSGPANGLVEFGKPAVLARTWRGEIFWFTDPHPDDQSGRLFLACDPGSTADALGGHNTFSLAELVLPSPDVDSVGTFELTVHFTSGRPVRVVVVSEEPTLPTDLVEAIVTYIDDDAENPYVFGEGCTQLPAHILRRRIREIEQSVRAALTDDAVSEQDYAAMRKYPDRLANIERLYQHTGATWQTKGPLPRQ